MRHRAVLLSILFLLSTGVIQTHAETPTLELERTAELRGHEGRVRALAFHPEGRVLASGGPDRTVRIWDLEKLEASAILRLPRYG